MYKKSLLAMALTSAAFSNVAMAAPTADIYGFVDIGLENYNESGIRNGSDVFPGGGSPNGNSDEQEFALTNNVHSRIGIKGEEAIEGGWKGTYRMEFKADVLESTGDSYGLQTRLGWLGLEKGKHSFKLGTQWSPFMQYSGWNTNRGETQGLASYFYVTDELAGSLSHEFRTSSTASYTYGNAGWGTSSPVSATVALHIGEDDRNATVNNKKQLTNSSGITGVSVAGAATFGIVTLNAVYVKNVVKESDAAKANLVAAKATNDATTIAQAEALTTEPSIYSVGGKIQATKELEFGFAYRGADRDVKEDAKTTSITVSSQYQLTDKLNVLVGYGQGEDDNKDARQLDAAYFGQLWYQVTDSRSVRFEFDHADYGNDGEVLATVVSMRQSF
jgi:hypothetical protein